jgi:hypothetical protein
MNSPTDYFQRLPKGKINGIFFLPKMRMEKGDSTGKVRHEGNGEALPDSFIDPIGDSPIHPDQGLADHNARVAVLVHGSGKPEEAADERPEAVIAATPRELIRGIGIQKNARGLWMNPFQFL